MKTSQKHDANLQKNTTLYFQVGLILALLMTWGLFEMQFSITEIVITEDDYDPDDDTIAINYTVEPPKLQATVVKEPASKVITKPPRIVKNTVALSLTKSTVSTELQSTKKADGPSMPEVPKKEPVPETHSIMSVSQVPIFPGCEGLNTNLERLDCMSKKLGNHVKRKFNTDLVSNLGIEKRQKIWVFFKIDHTGAVTEIQARSPYDALKREAVKVTEKLPKMEPAVQGGKKVGVMYSLPIVLDVRNW